MPGYTGQARPVPSGFCLRVRALFGGRLGGRRWSFWFEGVEPLVVFRSDRTVRGMVQLRMERGLGQVDSIKSGQTWVYRDTWGTRAGFLRSSARMELRRWPDGRSRGFGYVTFSEAGLEGRRETGGQNVQTSFLGSTQA